MKLDKAVQDLLDKTGAILKRDTKHLIYEFPNGQNVTLSKTPSGNYDVENSIREIRKASGYAEPPKAKSSNRKPKQGRFDEPVKELKRDLVMIRAAEASQRKCAELQAREANRLQDALTMAMTELTVIQADLKLSQGNEQLYRKSLDHLKTLRRACFWCRAKDWWRTKFSA